MGEYNWISRDFGATVKAFKAPGGLFNFLGLYTPNPKNADYLMALIPREECLYVHFLLSTLKTPSLSRFPYSL